MIKNRNYNIYVCGPTVYSESHIGNMRPIITFDIYARALTELGFNVNFLHNITDIDDKIIKQAITLNISEKELSEKYYKIYISALKRLNVTSVTRFKKVVSNMPTVIKYIKQLVSKKVLYENNKSLYFDTSLISGYGKHAKRKVNEQQFEKAQGKKNAADFVVWKNTSEGIMFDSPWSKGRPGWHTECAALINQHFEGKTIDLHGGAVDLMFPHHENEIVQQKALSNQALAKEWKYVGHVFYDDIKMSKVLGNVISETTFSETYSNDGLRMLFLLANVFAPLAANEQKFEEVKALLEKLAKTFNQVLLLEFNNKDAKFAAKVAELIKDWNFNEVRIMLFELMKAFNKKPSKIVGNKLYTILQVLGFNLAKKKIIKADKKIFANWKQAQKTKNFDEADFLRSKLQEKGII